MANWRECVFKNTAHTRPNCPCAFHVWLFKRRHDTTNVDTAPVAEVHIPQTALLSAPECTRLLYADTINALSPLYMHKIQRVRIRRQELSTQSTWRQFKKRKRGPSTQASIKPGELRLSRFLAVIAILQSAPWASIVFPLNAAMLEKLIASHLPLIVGKENWKNEKSELYPLINAYNNLSIIQNVIWITNRQQGKTTTLGLFLAAMSFMSPTGGNLFCVYSTNLDRAQELTKKAKEYIYWVLENEKVQNQLSELGLEIPVLIQDNERTYKITGQYTGVTNTIHARPRNPDSCRGDAPHACIVDEAGFLTGPFWDKFLYPLLQVQGRIVTCATTPPPQGSPFAVFTDMVIERNKDNDFFFTFYNHALTCAMCYEANQSTKCVHKLGNIPQWKSILRLTQIGRAHV